MKQVSSQIPGLDEVLDGGFTKPASILISGSAGTGKTTLAMQSIFNASQEGEVCVYVTSLNEPIAMVNNFMSKLDFYKVSLISKGNINYIPIGTETLDKGIYSFMWNLEESVERLNPDRVVIDPISIIGKSLEGETKRRFYYDLFLRMKKWDALVIATADLPEKQLIEDEISHVADGIISLSNDLTGRNRVRHLEILKMRGQGYMSGKHPFSITNKGIQLHRIHNIPSTIKYNQKRLSTGIGGLDTMLNGGLIQGTCTLLQGDSGTGKTIAGNRFIAQGARYGESGLIISPEGPEEMMVLNSIEPDMSELIDSGMIKLLPLDLSTLQTGELMLQLPSLISDNGIERVLIDGVDRFDSIMDANDIQQCIMRLSAWAREIGITSLFTTGNCEGLQQLDRWMDTSIVLGLDQKKDRIIKNIHIKKMKGSGHDDHIRQLDICKDNIEVLLPEED